MIKLIYNDIGDFNSLEEVQVKNPEVYEYIKSGKQYLKIMDSVAGLIGIFPKDNKTFYTVSFVHGINKQKDVITIEETNSLKMLNVIVERTTYGERDIIGKVEIIQKFLNYSGLNELLPLS